MKNQTLSLIPLFLCLCLLGCSEDGSNSEGLNEVEEASPIMGTWNAVTIGVVMENGSEDTLDDPCGAYQKVVFMNDGNMEVDNYVLQDENCQFVNRRPGTFAPFENEQFPDSNYELIMTQFEDKAEDVRYPMITIENNDRLRIQYPWQSPVDDDILFSFTLYERN